MKKIRVLIFDDEEGIRTLIKLILKSKDFEIFDFKNPSVCSIYKEPECNCPLNTMCADIIVTDVNMPIVNGIEFLKNQKAKGCKVKNILVSSAFVDEETLEEITEMGIKFLRKPFDINEFTAIIDEFVASIDPNRELSDWN